MMATPRPTPILRRTAAAIAVLACSGAFSQTTGTAPGTADTTTRLAPVVVTGRAEPAPSVAGWGDVPLGRLPFQAGVYGSEQLRELGAQRLSDVTRIDPAVSDAYNAEGYWDFLTVRGFVVDNRFNYRRDGLPISAETSIPLDNKERVEILKGISGLQAGTSVPGGLVNLVVKRPTATPLRQAQIAWRQRGTVLGAVDLSERFGADQAIGLRLNAAAERLDPLTRSAKGERRLFALAGEWRLGADTLVEAEWETSHRSQPSVPGFSLLGNRVPAPVDPRINLNNQPWSQPVVMDGDTGSIRLSQRLVDDWRVSAHLARQQLRTDDRLAYPFGCYDAASDTYYGDRYCPNGRYDLYDFRSENERRRTDALGLTLQGGFATGAVRHGVSVGVLRSQVRMRFQLQANNYVGQGNVQGTLFTPADPTLGDQNTQRDEWSTELHARDAMRLTPSLTAWVGVRHSRIERESVRTNGSRATAYSQSFTTPWVALSQSLGGQTLVYGSWGRGVESEVAPNRRRYTNAGQALPALTSRQAELGVKGGEAAGGRDLAWNLALFDIVRPVFGDLGTVCDSDTPGNTCTRRIDGTVRHRGLEANVSWRQGPWRWQGGAQWLQARRAGSEVPGINGLRPTNVPGRTLKAEAGYDLAAVPGLSLAGNLLAESDRIVLPDNSVRIPGFARVDAGLRYRSTVGSSTTVWRLGVDNLLDRRAWRESPYQFGHAYLFPLGPRTVRLSVEASL
jgi:iron complex outermembrane receptor protein